MDIRHIEYFLTIKKYEHLSAAAEFLKLSPPYLSKCLTALENELGVKLFDRVGRRLRLNENGENFARYAEQALHLLDAGKFSVQSNCYETMGNISIISYTYTPILTNCIHEYRELNPKVTFSIGDPDVQLEGQDPDFILRAASHTRGEIEAVLKDKTLWSAQALFQEERCFLVASDTYRPVDWERYGDSIELRDLRDAKFITMLSKNVFFEDITYELCQRAGFFPHVVCRTNNFIVKAKMIAEGEGVAFLPESCLEDLKKFGADLRCFRLKEDCLQRTIWLMHQKESLMTEVARDFYDFCLDYFLVK